MPPLQHKQNAGLERLDLVKEHVFEEPRKRINEGTDVPFFLSSSAYTDILKFLFQLNASMFPRDGMTEAIDMSVPQSPVIVGLQGLVSAIGAMVDEAPPEPGPRRFGNAAFRTWYDLVASRSDSLLLECLPQEITSLPSWPDQHNSPALEVKAYLLGSFGSSQRLDYGTGHELSFLAFLGCLWKLDAFETTADMKTEKDIVLGVIKPYLDLTRRLIQTYNLEPAGSHGVWGLDDHFFLPYILGSAQLGPHITDAQCIPSEGSAPDAPDPGDIVKFNIVKEFRDRNLYFGAIDFIYDVKKGPFWEHSPILYDISGVKAGWAKINKGMIKMYMAEVLSKFPVVQHFPFGSMFMWEKDPNGGPRWAIPSSDASRPPQRPTQPPIYPMAGGAVTAPWAAAGPTPAYAALATTRAPWTAASMAAQSVDSTITSHRQAPVQVATRLVAGRSNDSNKRPFPRESAKGSANDERAKPYAAKE